MFPKRSDTGTEAQNAGTRCVYRAQADEGHVSRHDPRKGGVPVLLPFPAVVEVCVHVCHHFLDLVCLCSCDTRDRRVGRGINLFA